MHHVTFLIADLSGDTLALAVDDTVIIDVDAAGHGWFVDATPDEDSEFTGQSGDGELVANPSSLAYGDMDLLTAVMHELGHVFGFEDLNPETNPDELMSTTLDTGERRLLGNNGSGQAHDSSTNLVAMDLTPDEDDANPNDDITTAIPKEGSQDGSTEGSSDPAGDPQGGPGGNGKRNSKQRNLPLVTQLLEA